MLLADVKKFSVDAQLGTGGGDRIDDGDFLGLGKEVDLDELVPR